MKSQDIPFVSSTFTEPLTTVGGGSVKSTFSFGPISHQVTRVVRDDDARVVAAVAPTGVNGISTGSTALLARSSTGLMLMSSGTEARVMTSPPISACRRSTTFRFSVGVVETFSTADVAVDPDRLGGDALRTFTV